jgi:hypothetical protein
MVLERVDLTGKKVITTGAGRGLGAPVEPGRAVTAREYRSPSRSWLKLATRL